MQYYLLQQKNDKSYFLCIYTEKMIKYCRMSTIYAELFNSIKNNIISHKIILNMPSEKATISAYNGIDYTINSIAKDIKAFDIKIEDRDCSEACEACKTFCITRNNHVYTTHINLKISKLEGNQIMFDFHIYA